MVKGVSRQVIVLHSPDREHFEQAIFILKDGKAAVTDDVLLKEANRLLTVHNGERSGAGVLRNAVCAAAGALATGLIWLLSVMI